MSDIESRITQLLTLHREGMTRAVREAEVGPWQEDGPVAYRARGPLVVAMVDDCVASVWLNDYSGWRDCGRHATEDDARRVADEELAEEGWL